MEERPSSKIEHEARKDPSEAINTTLATVETPGGCCGSPPPPVKVKVRAKPEGGPPPALPPRPPPRPRLAPTRLTPPRQRRVKKYVLLCTVCGGLSCVLGVSLLSVYLVLRTYTSSLEHFETIPTYVPAIMLLVTGFTVMCLARKKNRFICLMKICRACSILSPAACIYITVTTTVIHMNRLQRLRECVYTIKTQTCTCYSVQSGLLNLKNETERIDEGTVFNSIPDCQVIHGILYSCLRALFGLSVIGILICIFCCLLIYQLISHERKCNYWRQLELRCRYLYSSQRGATGIAHCACCQHNMNTAQPPTLQPTAWDTQQDVTRFSTPGNLYTPNPVVVDEVGVGEVSTQGIRTSWSWRFPWSSRASSRESPQNCYETWQPGTLAAYPTERQEEQPPSVCYPQLVGPPPPYTGPNPLRRPRPMCCQPQPQQSTSTRPPDTVNIHSC